MTCSVCNEDIVESIDLCVRCIDCDVIAHEECMIYHLDEEHDGQFEFGFNKGGKFKKIGSKEFRKESDVIEGVLNERVAKGTAEDNQESV